MFFSTELYPEKLAMTTTISTVKLLYV